MGVRTGRSLSHKPLSTGASPIGLTFFVPTSGSVSPARSGALRPQASRDRGLPATPFGSHIHLIARYLSRLEAPVVATLMSGAAPAQLPSRRGPARRRARASSPLPVPVHPDQIGVVVSHRTRARVGV